jgi:hypothetical protein
LPDGKSLKWVLIVPSSFISWLDGLSGWKQVFLICGTFIGLTWLGILVFHPLLRRLVHDNEPSNEAIIHSAGIFGLSYAVLLGLLTIATFQNTKDIVDTIAREASSLSTLYQTADGYPDPLRSELRSQLRDYARYVIDKDWPAHRRGVALRGGEHRLQVVRQTVLSFEPKTKSLELLHNEMLRYLDAMTVSRVQRLSAVQAAIPRVLWYIVVTGAFITIAFMLMLHMKFKLQIVLGGTTAFGLGIMIFLIYAMDHPLRGAVSVAPDAFTSVYDLVMKWDERG